MVSPPFSFRTGFYTFRMVNELAATAHMSAHHFARMFKEATGIPPHRYITLQRVDDAKQLLSDTELPLVEVAAAVGF
jgi:transcriptional regulator GlxA family with amidase domain